MHLFWKNSDFYVINVVQGPKLVFSTLLLLIIETEFKANRFTIKF